MVLVLLIFLMVIATACKEDENPSQSLADYRDETAPTVSSLRVRSSAATAVFSEEMDGTTITSSTFTVRDGTSDVPGTVSYSSKTAAYTFTSTLSSSSINVTLSTGIKDIGGNPLASAYSESNLSTADLWDFESSSLEGIATSSDSNAAWYRDTSQKKSGTYSYRAGTIYDYQKSCFEISSDKKTVSFFKRVSSESGYDYLQFYINGVIQTGASWSGYANWDTTADSYTTTSEINNVFKWCYIKDSSVSEGADTAWVDDIRTE